MVVPWQSLVVWNIFWAPLFAVVMTGCEFKNEDLPGNRWIFQLELRIWISSKIVFIPNKAQPYPSEQEALEQEKIQNLLARMTAKMNEIDNRKEPVYAFRVTSVKNAWSSYTNRIVYNPGKK